MYEIKQRKCNNHTPRGKSQPIVIVNHITAGSLQSVDNWFSSKDNDRASAHFCVGRNGDIHQYVDIRRKAWHAGLTKEGVQFATAPIIKRFTMNPNNYSIGIEHEGYAGHGLDGDLTEEQFWASVWLHKYIRDKVIEIYGRYIELKPTHVIGHFQVDPRRKPSCPGKKFPWERLYKELEIAQTMTLHELELRIAYKKSGNSTLEMANAILFRINDLREKLLMGGKWSEQAGAKLQRIEKFLIDEKLMSGHK